MREVTDRVDEGALTNGLGAEQSVTEGAQQAPAREKVHSFCGRRCGCRFVFPAWAVLASCVCDLAGDAYLEVDGTIVVAQQG